ncbi:Bone morphoproteintic protein 1 [Sparganum proliferum]
MSIKIQCTVKANSTFREHYPSLSPSLINCSIECNVSLEIEPQELEDLTWLRRFFFSSHLLCCSTSVERFTVNTDNGDGDDDDDDDGGGGGGGDGSNDKDDDEEEEGEEEEEEEEEEEGEGGERAIVTFVKIIWENILPGEMFAFDRKSSWEINSFDDPYDYQSIMHYGRNTFAKPGRSETVTPTDPNAIIGQRKKLSPSDVRQTNKLYNCPSCGRTLMQSSGTFSFPQMDSPLAGRSYQSDQPTEFELDTLNDADSSSFL